MSRLMIVMSISWQPIELVGLIRYRYELKRLMRWHSTFISLNVFQKRVEKSNWLPMSAFTRPNDVLSDDFHHFPNKVGYRRTHKLLPRDTQLSTADSLSHAVVNPSDQPRNLCKITNSHPRIQPEIKTFNVLEYHLHSFTSTIHSPPYAQKMKTEEHKHNATALPQPIPSSKAKKPTSIPASPNPKRKKKEISEKRNMQNGSGICKVRNSHRKAPQDATSNVRVYVKKNARLQASAK
jgi:hypothetical protein